MRHNNFGRNQNRHEEASTTDNTVSDPTEQIDADEREQLSTQRNDRGAQRDEQSGGQGRGRGENSGNRNEARPEFDAEEVLTRMDQNEDGSVTIDDFLIKALERAEHGLDRLDTDDDGLVSLAEFTEAPARGPKRSQEQDSEAPEPEEAFAEIDSNGDDTIDTDEMNAFVSQQVETHFNEIDTDGDAIISAAEITARHEERIADLDTIVDTATEYETAVLPRHFQNTGTQEEVVISYTSGDETVVDTDEFNINLDFMGEDWTDALMTDAQNAADYLSAIITNNIAAEEGLNDVSINLSLTGIDDAGGTVASTSTSYIWTDSQLPSQSTITFDTADVNTYEAADTFDDVALHEMMHAIGFGSTWEALGLVETTVDDNGTTTRADDTISLSYLGDATDSDNNSPVIETDGGSGTAGVHWDETVYGNELMTGYSGEDAYVSDMTLASLEDMGYSVDYTVNYSDFMV